MRCLCRPGWACSFLFLLFLAFPANLSPSENGIGFLAPGVCRCPRIRSQLGHTPPTGPVWGFAGVALPLLGLQNRTQGRTGASLGFLPQNKLTPPPKGGGAGYRVSWVCWYCPARSQLAHTPPTGPVRGCAGVTPYLAFKIAHRAAQGRVWFRLAGWRF